eukprot:10542771-Karenia_brevis.AAC.1
MSSNGLGALMAMMSMPLAATTPCGSCFGWYAGFVKEILRKGVELSNHTKDLLCGSLHPGHLGRCIWVDVDLTLGTLSVLGVKILPLATSKTECTSSFGCKSGSSRWNG